MRPKKGHMMERHLRIEDVAEWLGVKPSTVYSWLQRGVEAWVKKCERVGWRSRADGDQSHGQTRPRPPKAECAGSGAP